MKPLSYSRFALKFFGFCFYQLISFFPRRKNVWLLRSHVGFSDNAKYLLYQIKEKHPEICPIWMGKTNEEISRAKTLGFKAFHPSKSLRGIFYCLNSKVYICTENISDINVYLSGGAYFVNLWHGLGAKKMKWSNPKFYINNWHLHSEGEMRKSFAFKIDSFSQLFRKPDCMVAPSEAQIRDFYIPTFDLNHNFFIKANYPRNQVLLMSEEERLSFIQKYEDKSLPFISKIKQFNKAFIYMPTYRNDGHDFIQSSGIQWEKLNEVVASLDAVFIVKLHPFTRIDLNSLKTLSNVILFPPLIDVYTILPYIDCLITDYSSIYCDFLLLNKEVLLFPFDYDHYVKNNSELADYEKLYPGSKVYTFEDLLKTIKNRVDCHLSNDDYHFILKNYWEYAFNNVDIVDEIKKGIGYV